jgi:uncharacterized protein
MHLEMENHATKQFEWTIQKIDNAVCPKEDYWVSEIKDDIGNPELSGGLMKRQSPQQTVTNYITVLLLLMNTLQR